MPLVHQSTAKRRQQTHRGADEANAPPPWLLSPSTAPIWKVADTFDHSKTADLDFRYPLADGTCLTNSLFYEPIKTVARLMRDARYTRIDDSATHVAHVAGLMAITHALTLRNIWSYAEITPYDLEQLVNDCCFGVDALLHASERVQAHLAQLIETRTPLPEYRSPSGVTQRRIAALEVLRACNLPKGVRQLPRVAWYLGEAARQVGLETQAIVAKLDQPPELKPVSATSLTRFLVPLECLYVMRRHLGTQHLSFRPFARGASETATALGLEPGRTPTPPPRLALHLLEHSARWVVDYSKELFAALADINGANTYYGGRLAHFDRLQDQLPQSGPAGGPWPLIVRGVLRGRSPTTALSFSRAIEYLATAAFALIATFSAGRHDAVLSIEDDCLRGSDESGWWLRIYVAKTLQRHDWVPVPHVVARAFEVLLELSRTARAKTGSHKLFQWNSPFSMDLAGAVIQLDPTRLLDEFSAHVGVPLFVGKNGALERWHWSPHQFRRFFAILYFYRFDGASIEVLSYHLRHFDFEATKRYLTEDPDVAAIWTSVEWGYTGDLARSIVAGKRVFSGGMGAHLTKLARRISSAMRAKLQIVSVDRVGAAVALLMRRKALVLLPKPWVTCSSPRTKAAAKLAACRRGQVITEMTIGPDFSIAGPLVCNGCPHAVIETRPNPFVDKSIQHLELVNASDSRASTVFGVLERMHLVELKEVRDRSYCGSDSQSCL